MKKIISVVLAVALFATSCFLGQTEALTAMAKEGTDVSDNGTDSASQDNSATGDLGGFVNVSVDPAGKTANITWYGEVEQIRVSFYEDADEKELEDLQLLYEKVEAVVPTTELAVETIIHLEEAMPEYFVLKVSLEDSLGQSVTEPYISNAYTQMIREVSEKTADDYRGEGDRLVELTETSGAAEGSYLVLADDVLRIEEGARPADGIENTGGLMIDMMPANDGTLYCNLGNVGSEMAGQLEQIDQDSPVFIIDETVEGDEVHTAYYMFTAESASVDENGGSAVLKGTVDEGVYENGLTDTQTLSTFLSAANIKTVTKSYDLQKTFPISAWGSLDLDLHGKLSLSFVVNSSWTKTTASVTVINEMHCPDTEVDLDLPTVTYDITLISIPLGVTGLINFEFDLNFRISGTVSGGVRFDFDMTTGIEIGVSVGWTDCNLYVNNKSSGPTTKFQGFTLQGSVFLGPTAGFSLNLMKLISLSADLETGYEISGKLTSGHYFSGEKRYHACKDFQCVDGDVSYKSLGYSVSLNAAIFSRGISGDLGPTVQITPFYYSGTYNDSAATNCPHYGYRLYVHVKDKNMNPVVGAEVSYDVDESEDKRDPQFESVRSGKTDANGTATIYLPEGKHVVSVSAKDDTGHIYKVKADFEEKGYNPETDELYTPDLNITLDTTRYKISFIDLNQEGKATDMPDAIYTYPDQTTTNIPGQTPKKDGLIFLGWSKDQSALTMDYKPGDNITAAEDEQLYAVWAYETYTVQFDSNKPGNASTEIAGTMDKMSPTYKDPFNLAKNMYTLSGWSFTGWNTKPDGTGNSYTDQSLIQDPLENGQKKTVTLYAQWQPKKYTVTFTDENQESYTQEMTFDQAAKLDACKFTKANSIFTHWDAFAFGSSYSNEETVVNLCTLDDDGTPTGKELRANWIENNSTTIIIINDGKMVDTNTPQTDIILKKFQGSEEYEGVFEKVNDGIYKIDSSSGTTVPEGTYEVIFTGGLAGYDASDRTIEVSPTPGAYNFDFYTVEISADAPHATSWIGEKETTKKEKVLVGTQLQIGTEVDEGYSFESYTATGSTPGFENDDATKAKQTIIVTGQVLITGHPVANRYQVIFKPNFDGGGEPVIQDMVYDEPQNLFANSFVRYGYEFAGWTTTQEWKEQVEYENGECVESLTSVNNGVVQLYAQWTPVPIWIKFYANGGTGTMLDQETFYESGALLSPCEFTREHWLFTGWNTKEDGTGISYPDESEFVSYNGVEDSTLDLYAQWRLVDYTIDYDLTGGTLTEPNPSTYTYETEDFTLQNPVREGYIFLGWTGSNGNEPEKKVTIQKGSSGDRTYRANWKPEMKTITFDPAGGTWSDGKTGSISIDAEYDSEITLPDMPVREHYIFAWWQNSNEREYNPGHIYKVTKDETFQAIWNPVRYGISYDLAGGRVEGTNPIAYTAETEEFTLINPVREGYIFLGWTGSNGEKPETEVTIKKGSGGNRSYTANWKLQESGGNNETSGSTGVSTGDLAQPLLWIALLLGALLLIRRRVRR